MTQLTYGDYAHPDNEAEVSITREGVEAEDGFIYAYKEVWNITGILHGDTDAALKAAIDQLLTAYIEQEKDLSLTKGSIVMHELKSDSTLTGTRVVTLPQFSQPGQGELTTFRTYNITVDAEVAFNPPDLNNPAFEPTILKYEETLDYTGTGGPRFALLPVIQGRFQKQLLTEASPVILVQSGLAVGLGGYPSPTEPRWIDDEHLERRQIVRSPIRRRGGKELEYPIHWTYHFERNDPFPTKAATP